MSTQKNRPVLFELVKNRASSAATTWRAPLPAKLQAKQRAAEGDAPGAQTAAPVRAPAEQSSWTLPLPRFAYEVSGGQIRVGMNMTAAIIAGVVLLGLLLVAFQIGRSTASAPAAAPENGQGATTAPATTDKPVVATPPVAGDREKVHTPVRTPDQAAERRANDPPVRRDASEAKPDPRSAESVRPGVPSGVTPTQNPTTQPSPAKPAPEAAKPPTEPPASTPEMKKGYHYLVIQHFRKTDSETADAAARFLIANGIPCAVQNMKADIRVIATDAFLIAGQKEPQRKAEQGRANDMIRRVKQLGKEFAKTHGYAFDQCELRELK